MSQAIQPLVRGYRAPLIIGGVLLISFLYLVPVLSAGNYRRGAVLSAYGLMVLVVVGVLREWRTGIIVFSIWIVFEDLIRKSVVGGGLIIYFVKDFLIVITYISYAVAGWLGRRDRFKNPVVMPLLLCLGWALVGCLNPNLTSVLVPGVGLRMTFFYIPMIYLGYSFVDGEKRLRDLGFLLLSAGFVVGTVGIVQSIWGMEILNPTTPSDLFSLTDIRLASESGLEVPRVTSVFVDPGRFSQYLFFIFFVGLGVLGLSYGRKKKPGGALGRGWVWVCWLCALYGLAISGQRATVLWIFLTPVALLVDRGIMHVGMGRRAEASTSQLWIRLGTVVVLGLIVAMVAFPDRFEAAYRLYVESFDPSAREGRFTMRRPGIYWNDIVRAFSFAGHGTGSASLGLQYVARFDPRAGVKYAIEGGYASVLWEWGVVGLAIWLWWSILLVWKLWVAAFQVRGTGYHLYGFSIFLYAFFILVAWFFLGMQVYQNYLTQAYLWFMIGAAFKLPLLAKAPARGHAVPLSLQADTRS